MAETPDNREEVLAELEAQSAAKGPPVFKERVFRHALSPEERRHRIGGNGAPALDAPEPRRLRLGAAEAVKLGEAMYGARWKEEAAGDAGEHARALRRWASGESKPDPASLMRLIAAAHRKMDREARAAAALQAVLDDYEAAAAEEPPLAPPAPAEPEVDVAAGIDGAAAAFWLNGLTRFTGDLPTPLRAITAVRMNPRARVWSATVTIFDGTQHTLECDRGDDRTETIARFAEGPRPEKRELRILWDEVAGGWTRLPDRINGVQQYVPPVAVDSASRVHQPFNPCRPRGALRSPRRAEAARDPQGKLL